MKILNLMKYAKLCVAVSVVIILAGFVAYFAKGFTLGIDFSGGTILTLDMGQPISNADSPALDSSLTKYFKGDRSVSISDKNQAILRYQSKGMDDTAESEIRTNLINELKQTYPNVKQVSLDRVGETAGNEMRMNALLSVVVACTLMLIYIWIRFEVVFGVAAILSLMHDVVIMAAFMIFTGTQLNSSFIAAMLTIIGYSINDTIVVFDRIRENLKRYRTLTRAEIINRSYSETLVRTLNTSLTTLFTITALYILGVPSIKEFALPLIVGIVSGTYSSILIASPTWLWIREGLDKRNKKKLNGKKQGGSKQLKPSKSKA